MALPEVGDLAVLSRPHCSEVARAEGGKIGRVTSISSSKGYCGSCSNLCAPEAITLEGWWGYWTLTQFERIPPLDDLASLSDSHDIPVKTKEPA